MDLESRKTVCTLRTPLSLLFEDLTTKMNREQKENRKRTREKNCKKREEPEQ